MKPSAAVGGELVLGLAGAIGAGKSAVAAILARAGACVYDADASVKAILERPEVIDRVADRFGREVLGPNGLVDRRRLADRVFRDAEARSDLENMLHPLAHVERERLFAQAREAGTSLLVIDAPLLFEAGLDAQCDAVWFVDAPRDVRVARVLSRRGWTEAELTRRESAQWPIEEKIARSSAVVRNDGTMSELESRIAAALATLMECRG